jgi:hypothetical protein
MSVSLTACKNSPDDFTTEEHVQRISNRMRARDLTEEYPVGFTYEDFEVYPLYNENEEVEYYLIEFEPYGFMFVYISNELPKCLSLIGASRSMYVLSNIYNENKTWSPYIRDNIKSEAVFYNRSPYYITGNIEGKKYLLKVEHSEFICAIKKNSKFINLITGEEFDPFFVTQQLTLYITFINKSRFDL